MKTLTTVVLQLLMYWLLLQPSSQASLPASSGTKARTSKKQTPEVNICDLDKIKNPPFYCTCNNPTLYKATDSDCVILDNVKPDDKIWNHMIESQPGFEYVKFIVPSRYGEMNHVPTNTLRLLKNLTRVEFRGVVIKDLVEKAFSDIPSVTGIHLTMCSIITLNKYSFGNMTKLNTINLDDNSIHEINRDVFVSLPSLKKLLINRNNLTLIHDEALKHLTSLETLELSDNKISVITTDTFVGLIGLKHLNLNGNGIEMIGDRTFAKVPQLEELLLDQNKIEFISNTALEGLKNLRKLSLSDNKLVELQADVLSGTTSLNFLDLRNNLLRTITFEHIKPILQELYNASSHLYLEENQFICDCKLAWIFGVRNETSNKNLKESLGALTCLLESQNTNGDGYEAVVDNNETGVEVKADSGESYSVSKAKDPEYETEEDDGEDGAEDEDYEEQHPNSTPKIEKEKLQTINGKTGYIRQIADLKYDDLPCPEQEPLGSQQSSRRLENVDINAVGAATSQNIIHHCTLLAALAAVALRALL